MADKVVPSLKRVKMSDGSYVIVLPINTANECFYNVKDKDTVKMVLDRKLSLSGGVMTGGVTLSLSGIKKYNDVYFYNPGVNTSFTGALKFKLPKIYSNTSMSISISGYTHGAKSNWDVTVNGYSDMTTGKWLYCSASVNGKAPFDTISMCDDGTSCCIIFGNVTTAWNGLRFFVDEILLSNEGIDGWDNPYSVTFLTTLSTLRHVVPVDILSIDGRFNEIEDSIETLDAKVDTKAKIILSETMPDSPDSNTFWLVNLGTNTPRFNVSGDVAVSNATTTDDEPVSTLWFDPEGENNYNPV